MFGQRKSKKTTNIKKLKGDDEKNIKIAKENTKATNHQTK